MALLILFSSTNTLLIDRPRFYLLIVINRRLANSHLYQEEYKNT